MVRDKFTQVAHTYSQRFNFDPYYAPLIHALQTYLGNAQCVLEIGAANGIVPKKWDRVRRELPEVSKSDSLVYHSVEPVETAVHIAKEKAKELKFTYFPHVGTLVDAIESSSLQYTSLDGLVISRALHEMYLDYDRDIKKLQRDLTNILERKSPRVFVYADAEQFLGLSNEQTQRFRALQEAQIGHGHDPALDYLPLSFLVDMLTPLRYRLVEKKHLVKPVRGFDPSPWRFVVAVFSK